MSGITELQAGLTEIDIIGSSGGPFIPISDIATLPESQAGILSTKVVPPSGLPIFKPNATALQADLGGNARGASAVDLQQVRGAGTQVSSGLQSVIGGGLQNTSSAQGTTVSGGYGNVASANFGTVGGGQNNTASQVLAVVGGGASNTASDNNATVAGGGYNTASGSGSTVPGGSLNEASGDWSMAAGRRAKANADGVFAFADSTNADFTVGTADVIGMRFAGGYWLTGGDVIVGNTSGDGKLVIDQASTTGATPVLTMDQADLSEQFIKFITTIGVGNPTEAVGVKSLTTTHFVRVEIDGVGDRYLPVGTIAAGGSSAADTLVTLTPLSNEPPAANNATLDTRNSHPVLDFDDTTNESAVFSAVMPRGYSGGGLTVYIHFAMTSAVVGDVDWDVSFERIGDQQQDLDVDGFAAAQSVNNTTVPGTSGLVDIVSVAFTDGAQMDSIAIGEGFRIKVTRDAASDTAVGDAELVFVEIKET